MPEETTTQLLPVLLVTTAVDSDEAKAAVEAARTGARLLLVVPRVDGRYAKVGTVARLEESGRLPNGLEAAVLQGLHRGVLVSAASEAGGALWIRINAAPDAESPSPRARELGREYRAVVENLLESRGAPGVIEAVRAIEHPGQLADMSGFSPDLSIEQKVEVLETQEL